MPDAIAVYVDGADCQRHLPRILLHVSSIKIEPKCGFRIFHRLLSTSRGICENSEVNRATNFLDTAVLLYDGNAVGIADGAEPVDDDECGAPRSLLE